MIWNWDNDCYLINFYSVLIYWLMFHPREKCCTCMTCLFMVFYLTYCQMVIWKGQYVLMYSLFWRERESRRGRRQEAAGTSVSMTSSFVNSFLCFCSSVPAHLEYPRGVFLFCEPRPVAKQEDDYGHTGEKIFGNKMEKKRDLSLNSDFYISHI